MHLLRQPRGKAGMLLRSARRGNDSKIPQPTASDILFPREPVAALGIWWNDGGHPNDDGRRRVSVHVSRLPALRELPGIGEQPGACSTRVAQAADPLAHSFMKHMPADLGTSVSSGSGD